MITKIIPDIIIITILIFFSWKGRRTGLVETVFHIFSGIITFFGSVILAKPISVWINERFVYEKAFGKVEKMLSEIDFAGSTNNIVEKMNEKFSGVIHLFNLDTQDIVDKALTKQGSLIENLAESIATPIANGISFVAAFIAIFILLFLIIQLIGNILDSVAKLPILNFVNTTAGMLMGIIQGILVCWVVVHLFAWIGAFITPNIIPIIENTYLVKIFYSFNISEFLQKYNAK